MAKFGEMVDENSPKSASRLSADYTSPTFSTPPAQFGDIDTIEKENDSSTKKSYERVKDIFHNEPRKNKAPFAGDFALEMNGEPKKSLKSRSGSDNHSKEQRNSDYQADEENVSPLKDRFSPDGRRSKSGSPKPGCSFNQDGDSSSSRSPRSSEDNQDELSSILSSPTSYPKTSSTVRKLRLENERLQAEVTRLRRLVISGATTILADKKTPTESTQDPGGKIYTLEVELQLAKEALLTLKYDRRRLKAEKYDLLNQMKGLYGTLEDREKELRDFIRNFKAKMNDTDNSVQLLSTEREERERERWSLLRHARDEAERSLSLAARLSAKEIQLQIAQEQLQETRRQLASSGCASDQESVISIPRYGINGGAVTPGSRGIIQDLNFLNSGGDRGSCSADSGLRMSSDKESRTTSIAGNLSDSTTDGASALLEDEKRDIVSMAALSTLSPPHHIYQSISARNSSPTPFPISANSLSRQVDPSILSRSVEHLSSPVELETIDITRPRPKLQRPSGRGGTWGSISRVFARSRHKNKSDSSESASDGTFKQFRSWSPLTEESYAEKLCLLKEASTIPMERWKSPIVLAWLQVALGMPQYCARYTDNIKSGKIAPLNGQDLLELSDLELECTLGITHPLHRKKLRLAIEEHRHPHLLRYPAMAQLGHTWVSSEWLQDLGLPQYSENFGINMVDARMLEHLSKKELEKYLGVTRKFHQASIVHGIHLLRIMKYNRQTLTVRRHQCETIDADPLVWTNQRFIRWARSIDLSEYADNLKGSGVHGGLVVLEPSFNGDTMATALGIPSSKNSIRRLLVAELEALVLPARSVLEQYVQLKSRSRVLGGSLGRTYSRSCAGLTMPHPLNTYKDPQLSESRRSTIRGSISRALGLKKTKQERDREKQSPTSSSESSSVRSRVSPTYFYKTSRSGEESPVYATPFATLGQQPLQFNRRSTEEKDITGGDYNGDNINPNVFDSFIPRAHKNKSKHRRVRSINEIEAIPNEPT